MTKKDITYLSAGFISIAFLILIFGYAYKMKSEIDKKPGYAKGVVYNYTYRKSMAFVGYKFQVNGIEYTGSQSYSSNLQNINIRDTCYVQYAITNPEYNRLLYAIEDNRLLNIKKKKIHILFLA